MHPVADTAGAAVPAFLAKLWRLVEDPETNHLIYWNSDGRSFIIQNQAQFAREQLPLNYKHNNMASFIRQLNMYGFHKITSLDTGGLKFDRDDMEFSHPCFQRGHPFLLENIKRKIAHARNQPEEKTVATTSAAHPPEALNRVLTEVKMMRGKQEVLDNRFQSMKQENEALWREVVMLRQKHMKQQQIVNKLIQFLVTIVQPSGRQNMGMKRRLPLMLNDTPIANKSRKTGSSDYGLEITSMADSEEEDEDYMNLMTMDNPIVLQSKMVPASSSRGMISEIPNTPSSTRSNHDDLEDIDDIIEEEAPEADVNKIFEELSEATSTGGARGQGQQKSSAVTNTRSKRVLQGNGKTTSAAAVVSQPQQRQRQQQQQIPAQNDDSSVNMDQFLKFDNNSAAAVASTSAGVGTNEVNIKQEQQPLKQTWYANKDGFISAEMPTELFDDQSQSSVGGNVIAGLQDNNINPTLSEDISKKIDGGETTPNKARKFNGKHLQLARLPSNSGDVFSLATPEDFTMHLENVQSDLNQLKGILSADTLVYDPAQLSGPGIGSASPSGSMSCNPNVLLNLVDNDYMPKMFDDCSVSIPYQLSGDFLGDAMAGGSTSSGNSRANKEAADKQLLQYNPTLDFSELLDSSLDETSIVADREDYLTSNVDNNGSLNTPQPQ